jgi:hypothetical protein
VQSVPCDVLEDDFGTLIKGLVVDENAFALMVEMAENSQDTFDQSARVDMAQTRQRNIVKLKKKMENTRTLFREAELSDEDYRTHMAEYRAELAYWEAYTTEKEEVALQLSLCLDAIDKVARLWDIAEAEERRTMAHNLFEYIVYNLDKQRIVDFRLKPWANRFLVLRAAVAAEEKSGSKNAYTNGRREVPHTGLKPLLRLLEKRAAFAFLDQIFPEIPQIRMSPSPKRVSRNELIRDRYEEGEFMSDLSREYGISRQRISQIVHHRRR